MPQNQSLSMLHLLTLHAWPMPNIYLNLFTCCMCARKRQHNNQSLLMPHLLTLFCNWSLMLVGDGPMGCHKPSAMLCPTLKSCSRARDKRSIGLPRCHPTHLSNPLPHLHTPLSHLHGLWLCQDALQHLIICLQQHVKSNTVLQ